MNKNCVASWVVVCILCLYLICGGTYELGLLGSRRRGRSVVSRAVKNELSLQQPFCSPSSHLPQCWWVDTASLLDALRHLHVQWLQIDCLRDLKMDDRSSKGSIVNINMKLIIWCRGHAAAELGACKNTKQQKQQNSLYNALEDSRL